MSKIDRRSFIKLGSAAVAGAMVTGCSASAPAAGGKIRFVTNHGEADGPLFKTVLDKFAAKYPDIQVDWLDIPGGDEFYTALNTQGAAGSLPDVFYTRTFDVPVFASKGWTLDLQSLVDRDAKEVNVDDFFPAQIAQMQFKGHLYALPYDFSNIAIYFNKNMFDDAKVPYPTDSNWTWNDLLDVGRKFIKKDGAGITSFALDMYVWNWVFHGNMFGWGGKIWSDDFTTSLVNSESNLECLKWFISARKEGLYPEAGAMPQGVNPFAAGLLPMAFQGSWATNGLRKAIGDTFDFDVIDLPRSPSGGSCVAAAGGAWGIAATSTNTEAAWVFNKYLTSTEATNVLICEETRSVPGRKTSLPRWNEVASSGGKPPANVAAFQTQMDRAVDAPYPPYWQDYGTIYNNLLAPLISGPSDADPEQVLQELDTELKRIIELNKDSLG